VIQDRERKFRLCKRESVDSKTIFWGTRVRSWRHGANDETVSPCVCVLVCMPNVSRRKSPEFAGFRF
jgi:hypothetical protein